MKKLSDIAACLRKKDYIYILTHKNPDGDTLGSAYALCAALLKLGKTVKVLCNDPIPKKFKFMENFGNSNFSSQNLDFKPKYIVTVDISDTSLLGEKLETYSDKIDLSIDHHITHKNYARTNFVDAGAAANCEIIYDLLCCLTGELQVDEYVATCLYTGIATDTGCFLFPSTTAKSHKIAAKLIEKSINISEINESLFIKKSKSLIELERMFLESIKFHCDDKVAVGTISLATLNELHIKPEEVEGLSAIPMRYDDVEIGITIREISQDDYKISFRTAKNFNATNIAERFGGGGHLRAAGCQMKGELSEITHKILKEVRPLLQAEIWKKTGF